MIDSSRVLASLQREFPAPRIDPAWIQACAQALSDDGQDASLPNIREQFLFSDLSASTLPSGLIPEDSHDVYLFPTPILVQLISITEIGYSAFQLQTVQDQRKDVLSGVTRIRRMGDDEDENGDLAEGDDGRLPTYPRGMLKLEITDGERIMKALEYRRIDGLKLAETPLGFKLVLHKVRTLRSTLMLDPQNTKCLGYEVIHLEAEQPTKFTNSLLRRMDKPIPGEDGEPIQDEPPAPPRRAPPPARNPAPPPAAVPARRLTIPQASATAGPSRTRAAAPPSDPVPSPYFNQNATASSSRPSRPTAMTSNRPAPRHSIHTVDDSDDYDEVYDDSFIRQLDVAEASAKSVIPKKRQDESSDYGMDELDEAILGEVEKVEKSHQVQGNRMGSRRGGGMVINADDIDDGDDAVVRGGGRGIGTSRPATNKRKVKNEPEYIEISD